MRRTSLIVSSVAAVSLAVPLAGLGLAAGAAGSKGNPIKAKADPTRGFNPTKVTVKPGAVVYFKNLDKLPHDAVSTKKVKGKLPVNSGKPVSGSFKLTAPKKAGTYAYFCTVHPFMRGTLVVKK